MVSRLHGIVGAVGRPISLDNAMTLLRMAATLEARPASFGRNLPGDEVHVAIFGQAREKRSIGTLRGEVHG
jgi:hypothetical protein